MANQTCSPTLKNQILETSKSLTEIEVVITEEYSDCCFGKHQPYDENGNLLDWVGSNYGDFDGTPEYSCDNVGAYKRAKITIFKKNLEDSQTSYGTGNSQFYGFNLSLVQSMLSTFSHESHHNTDETFIQDLRNRRDGAPDNSIGAHDAIKSREEAIWNELNNCN